MDVILSGLSLLHEPDEIIEIRSIDPKPIISGYFRADSPAIAKEISRYPNRTFYQTMNRVKSACYAREQHERLVERPHETTTDGDIAGYQWLLIDADPVRPSGVSASREEKEAARRVAGMTMKKLMAMGFSEPVVADSGNGYHLLFHIHASPKEKQVLADFLAVLDMWFSTEQVKIDTAVFNPARITKLYGTIATKGASTPERPHRRSGIIRKPEKVEATSMTLIRNIAAERQKAVSPQENPRQRGAASSFDLDQFLSDHHIEVIKKIPISTGMKYQLAECPFDSSHKHGDAAVFAYSNGSFGFHCFHNSCAGYHWHEFREKVDPSAYANSPYTVHQVVSSSAPSRSQPGGAEGSVTAVKTGQPRMLDFAEIPNYDRSKIVVIRSRFQALDEKDHALGEYRGFSMSIMYNPMSQMYQLTLKGAMSHQVELGSDPRGNITRIDNALAGIPRRMQNVENKLNDLNQQMATAKAELGKPFPQEEELRSKSARLAELDAKLNLDRPAAQAEKKKPEQER